MFRRIKQAVDGLIAAMNRWRDAINRHADELEAEEPVTASNGQHAAETRPARARR
jgi:hypothetical protein